MELNHSVWYVRLFFWSLDIWNSFRDDYRYDRSRVEERGTNLCFFMKVVFFYMPLVFLLHAVFAAAAIASLTALPMYLFGGIVYGWTLVAITAVIGAIWVVKMEMRQAALRKAQVELVRRKREKQLATEGTKKPRSPGFFEVLWAYLAASKKKICPLITFPTPKEVR